MKLWRQLVAAVCAFSASVAFADVVYRWESQSLAPAIVSLDGTLVFSDEAYAAGGLNLSLYGECSATGGAMELCTTSPHIKDFTMTATTRNVNDATPHELYSEMPFYPIFNPYDSLFLKVAFGDYLSGSIFAERPGAEGMIDMGGSPLWEIYILTYYNNYCYVDQISCIGSTGYWRKVENSQVPEPPALLLLGIGLLALIAGRRRKT